MHLVFASTYIVATTAQKQTLTKIGQVGGKSLIASPIYLQHNKAEVIVIILIFYIIGLLCCFTGPKVVQYSGSPVYYVQYTYPVKNVSSRESVPFFKVLNFWQKGPF